MKVKAKKEIRKRFTSLVVTFSMILSLFNGGIFMPITAYAEGEVHCPTCNGTNISGDGPTYYCLDCEEIFTFDTSTPNAPTATCNPAEGGRVEVEEYGDNIIFTAKANSGFEFVNWSYFDKDEGQTVNRNYSEIGFNKFLLDYGFVSDLTAHFKPKAATTYTVTFDANGGSPTPEPQTVEEGEFATEPTAPTKDGYNFDGWYEGELKFDFNSYDIGYNTTLVARWTENSSTSNAPTATCDPAEGGTVDVTDNSDHWAFQANLKTGYNLVKWTLKLDGNPTEIEAMNPLKITMGLESRISDVVAVLESTSSTTTTYTVTFDSNGGSPVTSQTVNAGEKANAPEVPTKGNLHFMGWFVNPTMDNIINREENRFNTFDFNTEITGNVTLTALWAAPAMVDTIGLGQIAGSVATETPTFDDEHPLQFISNLAIVGFYDSFKIAAKAHNGYTFVKWVKVIAADEYEDYSTDNPLTVTVTEPIQLRAVFEETITPITIYTVTFDSAGGSAVSNQDVEEGQTVTKPEDPTKDGFTFAGWNYGENKFDFATTITSNITLTAKWTENSVPTPDPTPTPAPTPAPTKYTVTFNSNGGSKVASSTVTSGNKVSKPTNPTRADYTFLGWSKENGSNAYYNFDSVVTSNFTLYAQWEKKAETKVSEDSDITAVVSGADDAIGATDLNENQYVKDEIEVSGQVASSVSEAIKNEVAAVVGNDNTIAVNYLSIDISKIITTVNADGTTSVQGTTVPELSKAIEVGIPLSSIGITTAPKRVYVVREHGYSVATLTEIASRKTAGFVDGEFYYDSANQMVYIYSSKFSTYAILTSNGSDSTPTLTPAPVPETKGDTNNTNGGSKTEPSEGATKLPDTLPTTTTTKTVSTPTQAAASTTTVHNAGLPATGDATKLFILIPVVLSALIIAAIGLKGKE